MDDNTLKFWEEIIKLIGVFIGLVLAPLIALYVTVKTHKKVNNVVEKVETVEKKLDVNHGLINGNLSKLLKTTEELATAKEKARAEEKDKPKK